MDRYVALYSRVSRETQSTGLESQVRALKAYCEARNIKNYKIYSDEGISGAKTSRPALDELMAAVTRKELSAVVVFSFSRFARSTKHLLSALDLFNNDGVSFVSLSEALDTHTASGKMVFTVLAAVAELERELVRERVKNGLVNARAKGKRLGRPCVVRNTDLIIHLAFNKTPYREIARLAGCSLSTVHRVIQASVPKVVA